LSYSWKDFDHISSIIHEEREMEYRFVPAESNPESAPTLIILHGHGNYPPARAVYSDWNVFNPLDNFGFNGLGSWWLGENGVKFTLELFDLALEQALESIGQTISTSKLFIYGSSMGGYGAILHGTRIGALGVYANVPQIVLLNSTYSKLGMKKYFRPIFTSDQGDDYNDLRQILAEVDNHPLYFLCENRFGQENYLQEQCMTFVNFLTDLELNYHLEIIPKEGHNKNRRLSEVKKMFEQYCLSLD
tara:strand:+ start:205 stop:942 length:738 start_codon:yes stop_codon:yes gene_type:complete